MSETNGAGWLNKNWRLILVVLAIGGAAMKLNGLSQDVEMLKPIKDKVDRSAVLDSIQRVEVVRRLKRIERALNIPTEEP